MKGTGGWKRLLESKLSFVAVRKIIHYFWASVYIDEKELDQVVAKIHFSCQLLRFELKIPRRSIMFFSFYFLF